MTTAEYWEERMKELEDDRYQKSLRYYQDVEKQFRKAANDIQMDIEHWYTRLASNNGISYAAARRLLKAGELEEFKWTVEEYIKRGEENAVSSKWMKELENASARHHISYLQAMKMQLQQHAELLMTEFEGGVTDFLHKSYTDSFSRTAYEFEKMHVGSSLGRIDAGRIDIVVKQPWAQDGTVFSTRIWTDKDKLVNNLHGELSRCIVRGESPDSAVRNLSRVMDVSRKQAGRLVMTETAAIASAAQRNCYKELSVEKYGIIAALDSHTCDTCRTLDGRVFKMSDYQIGLTAPPFHPNCRCCTMPAFDDAGTEIPIMENQDTDVLVANKTAGVYNGDKFKSLELKVPEETLAVKGITPGIRDEMDAALADLEKEWDVRVDSMTVEPAGGKALFVTGWHDGKMSVVINRDASFDRALKRMAERYESGYFAGKSVKDYLAHETAHVMLYQDCETEQQYKAKYLQVENLYPVLKGISGYADRSRSGNEALAEAFVRYLNGEELPLIVKVLVESYYKRWKRNESGITGL